MTYFKMWEAFLLPPVGEVTSNKNKNSVFSHDKWTVLDFRVFVGKQISSRTCEYEQKRSALQSH